MINQKKFSLTIGIFAAVMHAIWSIIVAIGLGQWWIDFATSMHFMSSNTTVMSFDFGRAIGLVVLAFIMGYIVSSIFAMIWNKFHK
jgi:hypothetical protein